MRLSVRGDEGFSLLEVLFAAFIAFFILTAVFAVLVSSSGWGRIARADTIATELAQLVVEQARSLPYESIGTTNAPAGQPAGVLLSQETTTYQGFSFKIIRQIVWVDDPSNNVGSAQNETEDYKQLTVQVSWKGGHITPIVTFVRDNSNIMPTPPAVTWYIQGNQGVPPNSVLFTLSGATRVWDGSSNPSGTTSAVCSLQASASIDASRGTIVRMDFYNGSRLFMQGYPFDSLYVLAPSTGFPCESYEVPWTVPYVVNLDAVDASGVALFPEGKNTVKAVAYANTMGFGYQLLTFTVDRRPPNFPPGAVVTLTVPADNHDRYNGAFQTLWTVPLDGQDAATKYDVLVEPSNGGAAVTFANQPLGGFGTAILGSGLPAGLSFTPFSAYRVSLYPRSPRGLVGTSPGVSAFTSNCPRLTGTIFNQATSKKATASYRFDLVITPPETGLISLYGGSSVLYDVYAADASTYTYPGTGDIPQGTPVVPDAAGPTFPVQSSTVYNRYMQVVAKIRAADGSVVATLPSNVLGPPTTAPIYQRTADLTLP